MLQSWSKDLAFDFQVDPAGTSLDKAPQRPRETIVFPKVFQFIALHGTLTKYVKALAKTRLFHSLLA
jgi:hypothetical protein